MEDCSNRIPDELITDANAHVNNCDVNVSSRNLIEFAEIDKPIA